MNLTIKVIGCDVDSISVKNMSRMWAEVKDLFKKHEDARIIVEQDGKVIKDLTMQERSNGKKWMVNAIKENAKVEKIKPEKKSRGCRFIAA